MSKLSKRMADLFEKAVLATSSKEERADLQRGFQCKKLVLERYEQIYPTRRKRTEPEAYQIAQWVATWVETTSEGLPDQRTIDAFLETLRV